MQQSAGLQIYKGLFTSIVPVAIYRALYFGIFDTLKVNFIPSVYSFIPHFALGTVASAIGLAASYPFEVIKNKCLVDSAKKLTFLENWD